MTNQSQRIQALFLAALELPDSTARREYLDRECAGDVPMRQRVDALLSAHDATGGFGAEPSGPELSATHDASSLTRPGMLLAGRYKLLEAIGEGGMGTVWMAEQREPVKRKVAIKLVKAGMDSKSVLARFEAERQALAMMDHPNIAKVFDGGMTEQGRPFFVMEFVKGVPLTDYCDQARLSLKERLNLFVPVCQAVQHAHQKGIIHRDLKPSNILICLYDGKPVPKVIDFGLAKAMHQSLTEHTLHTAYGMMVGTPLYMSPEQAEHNNLDVDTRTDIYSLGVILYELLTGSTPLERQQLKDAAYKEILRLIKEVEPPKPSTRLSGSASLPSIAAQRSIDPNHLRKSLTGDLDWIVMKALDKERSRRYESANGLARDIERFLNDEAVEATPPTAGYRLKKFARKHRAFLSTAASFALLLVVGTAVSTWQAIRATRAEGNAQRALVAEARQRQAAEESQRFAETERIKAEAAVKKEAEQRARAERREKEAIDAVKRFGDVVANNPELKNNPSLESLRKTLFKEPLAFFKNLREQLHADNDARSESLARLANAAYSLGSMTDLIGDKRDSLQAYEEALANQQKVVQAHPTVVNFGNLADIHGQIGGLLREMGRQEESFQSHSKALSIRENLVRDNPKNARLESELASSLNDVGINQASLDQGEKALRTYERALDIFESLASDDPSSIKYRSGISASYTNIGNILSDMFRTEEALLAYQKALAIHETLVQEHPEDIQIQSSLAVCLDNRAGILRDLGRFDEAVQAYQQSLAIQEKLSRENPTFTHILQHFAISQDNLGLLLGSMGRLGEAIEAHQRALTIREKLVDGNPSVRRFLTDVPGTLNSMGKILHIMGRYEEAIQVHQRAEAILEKLALENPDVIQFQADLAESYCNIGIALLSAGRRGDALKAFEQDLSVKKALAREHPSVDYVQAWLAESHIRIGGLLQDAGRNEDARKEYAHVSPILDNLGRKSSVSPLMASSLGVTLNENALSDLNAQRFTEANDKLVQAIAWQRKALIANPSNAQYRLLLILHLKNLVVACGGLNDFEGAQDARHQLAELAASDPESSSLDQRLQAVLGGEPAKDAMELLAIGERAYHLQRFTLAAGWFGEALERDPALAEDRDKQFAYNAACVASMAGNGQDIVDPQPDPMTKSKLRGQALAWLQDELERWFRVVESAKPESCQFVVQTLDHWKIDMDLFGVRGDAIEKLPESEREAWRALWKRVDEVRSTAAKKSSEQQP